MLECYFRWRLECGGTAVQRLRGTSGPTGTDRESKDPLAYLCTKSSLVCRHAVLIWMLHRQIFACVQGQGVKCRSIYNISPWSWHYQFFTFDRNRRGLALGKCSEETMPKWGSCRVSQQPIYPTDYLVLAFVSLRVSCLVYILAWVRSAPTA